MSTELQIKADEFDVKIHKILEDLKVLYSDIEIIETDNQENGYSKVDYIKGEISKEIIFKWIQ